MGMFDRVWVPCPQCGVAAEFQSKSGGCHLTSYVYPHVPHQVLVGIEGDTEECRECGTVFTMRQETYEPFSPPTIVPFVD